MTPRLLAAASLALLCAVPAAAQDPAPRPDERARFFQPGKLRALVLSGRNNHDWRTTTPFLRQLLVDSGRFDVRVVEEPDGITARTLAPYDVVVSDYCGPRWDAATERALVEFVRGGKGLVAVHGAAYGFSGLDVLADRHVKTGIVEPAWREHGEIVGGYWPAPPAEQFHGARHSFRVKLVDREHPVSRGFSDHFVATDELYHRITLAPSTRVLATAYSDPATGGTGRDEPILWVKETGRGRAYFTALGHELAAMQNPGFQAALLRGAEWAASGAVTLPVDAGAAKPRRGRTAAARRDRRPRLHALVLHRVREPAGVALDARRLAARGVRARGRVALRRRRLLRHDDGGPRRAGATEPAGVRRGGQGHRRAPPLDLRPPEVAVLGGAAGRTLPRRGRPGAAEVDLPARRRAVREDRRGAPDRRPGRPAAARRRDLQGNADLAAR